LVLKQQDTNAGKWSKSTRVSSKRQYFEFDKERTCAEELEPDRAQEVGKIGHAEQRLV
jgi:hypothetical protein